MTPEEKKELLARALAGDATPAEVARLAAACQEDLDLLAELSRHTVMDRLLASAHLYPDGEAFTREVALRLHELHAKPAPFVREVSWRLRWQRWLPQPGWALAGAIAMLALIFGWRFTIANLPVAYVERTEAVNWPPGQMQLSAGQGLPRGHIRIATGYLELRMESGVTLILEGPAEIELQQRNRCFLQQGRAVARVPKAARGFVLDSPRGHLVDLGTEFGVSVDRSGDMEVHVLKGLVEASAPGQKEPLRLHETEAARFDAGTTERMRSNPLEFTTELPPRGAGIPNCVHWSFDEGRGNIAGNTGSGLGPANSDATLTTYTPRSPGPAWTTGQFGSGVYLDGEGAYLESPFTGIAGSGARTVAFWIKVPRNLGKNQGYGIINWGSLAGPGMAWQVSVNPKPSEGPLGRLRIGVFEGPVVGTTDLRDERWHHCAVVMYGGHRPDISTHVLLYVDGELEPSLTKAVREIRTDTDSRAAHGIWMGRPLSIWPDRKSGDLFFHGWLDEVFVFDQALSQEQIRQLMKENRLTPAVL